MQNVGTKYIFDYHDLEAMIDTIDIFSEDYVPVEEDVYLTAATEDVCKISGISSNQIAP